MNRLRREEPRSPAERRRGHLEAHQSAPESRSDTSPLDSDLRDRVLTNRRLMSLFPKAVAFRTHTPDAAWELQVGFDLL